MIPAAILAVIYTAHSVIPAALAVNLAALAAILAVIYTAHSVIPAALAMIPAALGAFHFGDVSAASCKYTLLL